MTSNIGKHSRRVALALLLALPILAQSSVFFSANGTTYHSNRDCASLKRSKSVFRASESEAKDHGLHQCRTCYKPLKEAKPSKNGWATQVK